MNTYIESITNYNWSGFNIENIKRYIKIKNKPRKIKTFIEQLIQLITLKNKN